LSNQPAQAAIAWANFAFAWWQLCPESQGNPFMKNEPTETPASANPLGTTMRIDLSPEMLEEAKRGKSRIEGRRKTGPIITIPKPRAVAPSGGVDFQQLFQNIYDAAIITDLNGEIVMVNVRANQFFLTTPGQFTHDSILGLICGTDDSLLPTIMEALKADRFVLMQAYCLRTDGSYFPAEISVNRLRLGGQDHLSFFVRDITLRKEQEERLRTGNTALQNSSSGIIITGLRGQIEYANPAFLSFFALTDARQVEGHDVREFLCEPETADKVISTTGSGETWSGELEMKRADGSTFFGQVSVAANLNTDGEQVGMVLSVLDVTPQKRAQRQLQAYAAELHEKNSQMQEDLNIASELHRAFLPSDFQVFPPGATPAEAQLQLRNLYCPSGTIGGDFFDIRALSDHEVALFISDVMGHGIRSALVVATIRGLIEQLRPLARDPGAFLTQLNATYTTIFKHIGGNVIFSTALYAVIDTRTGQLRCANASQPRPYVLRRGSSGCEHLVLPGRSAALGIFPDSRYEMSEFQLAPKDLLLLYTDGLSEVENSAGDLYETRRFEEALAAQLRSPAEELLAGLVADAKDFSGRRIFEDDVCLLAIEVERLAPRA
jgi:sigma-B regulation protein RsbU (phosphoserine phosphatase)